MNAQPTARATPTPFLRKITPKTVCDARGIDLLSLPRPVKPQVLYDLYGEIRSHNIKPDKSNLGRGDSINFVGRFKAEAPPDADGVVECWLSGSTYIPVLDEIILQELQAIHAQAEKDEITAPALLIALRVAIKTAPTGKASATGYEYDVQRLMEAPPHQNDPIEIMRSTVQQLRLEHAKPKETVPAPQQAATPVAGTEPSKEAIAPKATKK